VQLGGLLIADPLNRHTGGVSSQYLQLARFHDLPRRRYITRPRGGIPTASVGVMFR
jgi:hypothetical protein